MTASFSNSRVAVFVPTFPRFPDIRPYLASLCHQTRPPDVVVLLDDRTNSDIKAMSEELVGLSVEVFKVETSHLPAAINAAVEKLDDVDFVCFLQAGNFYKPTRLEKCLEMALAPNPLR